MCRTGHILAAAQVEGAELLAEQLGEDLNVASHILAAAQVDLLDGVKPIVDARWGLLHRLARWKRESAASLKVGLALAQQHEENRRHFTW